LWDSQIDFQSNNNALKECKRSYNAGFSLLNIPIRQNWSTVTSVGPYYVAQGHFAAAAGRTL